MPAGGPDLSAGTPGGVDVAVVGLSHGSRGFVETATTGRYETLRPADAFVRSWRTGEALLTSRGPAHVRVEEDL